jgi:hypothetical protein
MLASQSAPLARSRLMAAAALLLILGGVLLAMPPGAAGAGVIVTVSQHDFVAGCKAQGGTPQRVTTHVVKCTNKDGSTITCNFDTKQCTTTPAPLTRPPDGPAAPIGGGGVVTTGARAAHAPAARSGHQRPRQHDHRRDHG